MGSPDFSDTQELLNSLGKNLEQLRVLIIDRYSSARNLLRVILSTLGITAVHNAARSVEVLRQVKAYEFDVIFADYHLDDGRDSQQMLEELRQQHLISLSTVFILLTAERAYRSVVSVAEWTPDDYLIKPFTAELLEARLARALYRKKILKPVFRHLDSGAYVDALAACETLLAQSEPPFVLELLRQQSAILNTLGRFEEARAVFRQAIDLTRAPWARMGLAVSLKGLGELAEAKSIGLGLIEEFPEYLAVYDFVAGVCEALGEPEKAQQVLEQAIAISPDNSIRQRRAGDIAARNDDLEAAERAYGKVLERRRGSSLRTIDDYANLSRVMLDRGNVESARRVTQELRRDYRGDAQGELAALVMDSLCAGQDGEASKARQSLEKALSLREKMQENTDSPELSQSLSVDLARACLVTGDENQAQNILGKVASENHEDQGMIARIQAVFAKTGHEEAGRRLLAEVGREIVEINDRGAQAERDGDHEASLQTLIEAAERIPSVQFLTDASKAIFARLDRQGWNEEMAVRGVRYLQMAHTRDSLNPKVISAREMYLQVARKYGVEAEPPGTYRGSKR